MRKDDAFKVKFTLYYMFYVLLLAEELDRIILMVCKNNQLYKNRSINKNALLQLVFIAGVLIPRFLAYTSRFHTFTRTYFLYIAVLLI